jgi:NAD-dependent dihydropyrimidine dehydrogenase PreA subunit
MIVIRAERCDGCGACVEVCPTGALYLVDGKANLDLSPCRECEECIPRCPTQAIICEQRPEGVAELVHAPAPSAARELAHRAEPAVIHVESAAPPMPLRARVLPAIGAALAWAGREIVPRLADRLLDTRAARLAKSKQAAQEAAQQQIAARMAKGAGSVDAVEEARSTSEDQRLYCRDRDHRLKPLGIRVAVVTSASFDLTNSLRGGILFIENKSL